MKEYRKSVLTFFGLLLVFVWSVAPIAAQQPVVTAEYSYKRYTTQDGLPNLLLETVFQDKSGYLWIATYRGFVRFDGIKFTPFLAENNINILHFENGRNGEVRAYSYHDIYIIDKNDSIRAINIAPAETYLNTYNSRDLPEGYLIFENEDASKKYLVHTINDTIEEILRCPELDKIYNSKPFLDEQNNTIYLSSKQELNIYNINTHTINRIEGLQVECFLLHHTLGLLAFGTNGIYRLTDNSYKILSKHHFNSDLRAKEMADGSIIIKDKIEIYRYRSGTIESMANLNARGVDMYRDRENNIWVASFDGLFNFFQFDFKNYYLKSDRVRTVLEDINKNVWIGTNNGNLLSWSNGQIRKVAYPDSKMIAFRFGSVAIGDSLYFPRNNDVLIYNKDRFSWAGLPYRLEDYDGYCKVVPYTDKRILVLRGTGVHLCDLNGKSLRFYSEKELKQQDFHDIIADSGQWVVCGSKGLSLVQQDSIHLIESGDNSITTTLLCMDEQKQIWSGSENRLNLLSNGQLITVYRFKDDVIQGIFTVNKDYLLITTLHGIHFFNVSEYLLSGKLQFVNYDFFNGFTGLNPQSNALSKDHQGLFWLPCNDCLVSFDPQKLIRQIASPNMIIQHFAISKDNVKWKKVIDFANTTFSYKNKNFKFSVIGLNYSAVENIRYHYRLKGFQENWSEPTKSREITFNNLPPGKYQFEIYADAGTDESKCETQTYAFTITPAFWQTWWFWTLAIAISVGCLVWIIYYYLKKKQLENIKRIEREREMNELRVQSVRLKSIPHFNSNVLASIEYYMMAKSKEESNQLLTRYSRFTNITLHEIDKANRSLKDEIDYVRLYLELEKLRFGDKLSYSIDVDENTDTSIMIPNMVLHTYAENAVKHGIRGKNTPGHVSIKAASEKSGVLLSVEDDGIGREESRRRDPDREGHGLRILTRQIELYNQQNAEKIVQSVVDLKDAEGKALGTRFEMFVPNNYQYL